MSITSSGMAGVSPLPRGAGRDRTAARPRRVWAAPPGFGPAPPSAGGPGPCTIRRTTDPPGLPRIRDVVVRVIWLSDWIMTPVALVQDLGRLAPRRGADPELFVGELSRQLAQASAHALPEPAPSTAEALRAAMREKIELSEVAALWMAGEFDLELKLAFARLCGDQARHYRLLADRLQALDAGAALADLCQGRGDEDTARLQREVIGPEEAEHREMGSRLLVRFALTPEDQERARRALARAVQLSEERREPGRGKPAAARGSAG